MAQDLWVEENLLVDGKLEPASGGKTFENVNPTTEEVAGVVADASADDMDRAIGAARRAFDEGTWSTDVDFRIRCLRQLQTALENHRSEFTRTLVTEIGCPISLTGMAQYDTPVGGIGWVADLAERYEWEEDLGTLEVIPGMPAVRTAIREPIGVVGAITPWNYPVQINLAEDRTRARGRQHGRPEARARLAVGRDAARADHRRRDRHPRGRRQRDHVLRPRRR